MARIQKPARGRLIVSIIYSSLDGLADGLTALERKFGRVQYETMEIECQNAGEYLEEMGDQLQRRFFSFEQLVGRDELPSIKNTCHKIEPQFSDIVGEHYFRTVNFDPGILSLVNLTMSSHREMNHRVYLRDGVYAEQALIWSRGQFVQLPWTLPDYCDPEAIDFFCRVRASFDSVEDSQAALFSQ